MINKEGSKSLNKICCWLLDAECELENMVENPDEYGLDEDMHDELESIYEELMELKETVQTLEF